MADLESLQKELKAAKEKWPDYVKLGKAKKESETFPYPVWLSLAVQQPRAARAFDVFEIPVKLYVDGLEPGQIRVEVKSDEIPAVLQPQMQEEVLKMWKKYAGKKADAWGMLKTLEWVEANFAKLLLLDPDCVCPYDGCDENDASMRRYAINVPAAVVDEPEEEEGEEDSEDDEVYAQAEMARRIQELLASTDAVDARGGKKMSQEEIDRKKKEAEEMGEKAKLLSKAEKAELNKTRKEKAGHRTAKTGASAKKFEGEGAATKEEKKKRQEANKNKRFGLA